MPMTIINYLERTSERYPDKIAFADLNQSISFSDLIVNAKKIATAIAAKTDVESVIPFYMEKGVSVVVGFMGSVYAGCAYSQLNLKFPNNRLQSILESLKAPFVITDQEHASEITHVTSLPILIMEDILNGIIDYELINKRKEMINDNSPLYVNFTSGSTGVPKGVVVSHRNVINFITEFTSVFKITSKDVLANQAPFDFDVSVKDIYSGLFTGARVEIIPTSFFIAPIKLMDFLCERKVTIMIWAVSALCFLTTMKALKYKTPETIRAIMFSGEVMPVKHLNKLQQSLPDIQYVNLYGPTEITCNCTYYELNRKFNEGETIPIGIPFGNSKVFLLDDNDSIVTEPGGVGELCVSGNSVALGYLRNEEKTRECFVQNPLNDKWDERTYRTGDLIKILENGDWVYLTRKDFQVKHMGHRIELTEIDTALQAVQGIDRACCQYLQEKGKIIAFVSGDFDLETSNNSLRSILPDYMIPNVYYTVETMPLNKNGKIDRQALMTMFMNENK